MPHKSVTRRAAIRVSAVLGLLLVVSACSKKQIVVDPNDGLEGVASESQLIVWRENPNPIYVYQDLGNPGPSWEEPQQQVFRFEDVLIGEREAYETSPGTVRGFIFDYTRADQFEILRQEGAGFRGFKDFLVSPARRFPGFDTDLFLFSDPKPLPGPAPEYVGRGAIEGLVTAFSPKTNVATVTQDVVDPGIVNLTPTGLDRTDPPPTDSVFVLEWSPYPGAAGYWLHAYTYTTQNAEQKVVSGVAAPFYVSTTRDHFLAYFPATSSELPRLVSLKNQYPILIGQNFLLRISAVNESGQLIAYTSKTRNDLFAELAHPASWAANRENYIVNFPPGASGTYEVSPLGVVAFQFWGKTGFFIQLPNSPAIMMGAGPAGHSGRRPGSGSP